MVDRVPVANLAPDARGRLTLGKWLADGLRYLVYAAEDGTVTLEPVR